MSDARRPPSFEEATNRRQKVRAAGMNPDYWYAVEYSGKVKRGQVVEVVFWKRSIALFRGEDGKLRALENRCAHRSLKLTFGGVQGCDLVCGYHGWCFDGDTGKLARVDHDLFGHAMPSYQIESYPVQERYGLIWIFPGDVKMATVNRIPEIPELEGPDRWACVPIDATWKAHHSMILDNVSDFSHEYLHRKYRPFTKAKLTRCEASGDKVYVSYDTKVGTGRISKYFIDRKAIDMNSMDLCYEYPYQWSNTDGRIKHWLFVLPIDERTTRGFFLFHFDQIKVPLLPLHFPRPLMNVVLRFANKLHIKPLLDEDGRAVEAEQAGYDAHFDAPIAELNPAVNLFQNLTIRKWEEHLAKVRAGSSPSLVQVQTQAPAPRV